MKRSVLMAGMMLGIGLGLAFSFGRPPSSAESAETSPSSLATGAKAQNAELTESKQSETCEAKPGEPCQCEKGLNRAALLRSQDSRPGE